MSPNYPLNKQHPENSLPENAFWQTFQAIHQHDYTEAEAIQLGQLQSAIPTENAIRLMVCHLSPWWEVFNTAERHGNLGRLAAEGNIRELERLCLQEAIAPVQAAHAIIECGLGLTASPIFDLTSLKRTSLLQTYELEAAIVAKSPCVSPSNILWLCQRRKRAIRFMNNLALCIKEQEATAIAAETASGFACHRDTGYRC